MSHFRAALRRPLVHAFMTTAAKPAPFGPDLRSALIAMVRKRVPESEVEDIVQSALAEAIESPHAPADSESLRRWIFGVAKNKVVDYHRRAGRESFDMPDVAGTPAPHVEADFLRWAERNLPSGDENQKTLDWMLREGEGEKLESIAESEKLPPPRVRQRVSRLRRHFKENWQREVALLAALGVIVGAVLLYLRHQEHEPIAHDPQGDPRAEPVRRLALEKCVAQDWAKCVEGLDEAKRLDPAGDARPDVQRARQDADNHTPRTPGPAPLDSASPPSPTTAPPLSPSPTTAPPLNAPPESSAGPVDSSGRRFPTPAPSGTPPIQKPSPKSKVDDSSSDFGSMLGTSGGSGFTDSPGSDTKAVAATKKAPNKAAKPSGAKTPPPASTEPLSNQSRK